MITVVTTYNLEIFKLFYTHKHHEFLKKRMLLYVDQDDSSEFRKIIDPTTTFVFDKKDFRKYYGEKYLSSLSTFSKIYFINMLLKENLLDDSFYFTDDDVLFFDNSFEKVIESEKAVYSKDMILIIDRVYPSWKKLYSWISKNFDSNNNLCTCATNFYFPKSMIPDLKIHFNSVFDEFIQVLYEDQAYIEELNNNSRSLRQRSFAVFYLDTPFFNSAFPRLGMEKYQLSQIYLTAYSHLRKIKEKLNTKDTGKILEKYFSTMKSYPAKQPLVHFSVTNKLPLMRDCYNYLNGKEYACENIDDILVENPKEKNYLIKNKKTTKSLF